MSLSIDPALQRLIEQVYPAAQAAGSVSPLQGLTGLTQLLIVDDQRLLARRQPGEAEIIPGVCRQREYRLLRKLATRGLAAAPLGYRHPWLLLPWQPGDPPAEARWPQQLPALAERLARLHRLPPLGYPINLTALLWRYWQLSDAGSRHPRWLRALQRLSQRGEPRALRRVPLHLDVHRENLVLGAGGLRLIDWEYAADGDLALELCMLQCGQTIPTAHWAAWLSDYARRLQLNEVTLTQQIVRWRPWVRLLMASWYTLRSQQCQDVTLRALAQQAWQQIDE